MLAERVPALRILEEIVERVAQRSIVAVMMADAENLRLGREQPRRREIGERRDEQPAREIAERTEDDDRRRGRLCRAVHCGIST